jgi:outer membrane protein TolC
MGRIRHISLLALSLATVLAVCAPVNQVLAAQEKFTLKECIDLALERNVGVIAAKSALSASKYNLLDAWGDVLPSAGTSAGYGYYRTFARQLVTYSDTATGVTRDTLLEMPGRKSYSASLNLSMTLFDGGATWFRIKQSSLNKTASKNDLRQTITSTAYNVKQAYYGLVMTIMLRKVQEEALVRSKKQLEITTSRFELGSASLSEKLKAQVTVATDSLTLLQRVNDIKNAEFNLSLLMNRDVALPLVPVDTLQQVSVTAPLETCLATALDENPSLKKNKADFDAAKVGVWLTRAAWVPSVNADMSWRWSTSDPGDWFKYKYNNGSYSFGISIGYSIFDSFRKKTNYSRARLSELTSRETYDAARNNLVYQVRQSYLDIQRTRLQYEVAQLAETSAQEDMKLQQERYRLGASSILDLLNAQYSLTNAQYSRVQALYELNTAVAAMAKAMGQM